jgi:hypothetical protein
MSLLNKLESYQLQETESKDIEYLKQSAIGGIVIKGLAELYKVQPQKPITFLANWLLNESRSKEIKKKVNVF